MRIGKLAGLAGVRPTTVRFYERTGLLARPERTPGGYRDYAPEALDDLRFIAQAQASGLRLADVREVMHIAARGHAPCQQVRAAVVTRLADVEARLGALRTLRRALRATLERLDRSPNTPTGCRCAAIESAATHPSLTL